MDFTTCRSTYFRCCILFFVAEVERTTGHICRQRTGTSPTQLESEWIEIYIPSFFNLFINYHSKYQSNINFLYWMLLLFCIYNQISARVHIYYKVTITKSLTVQKVYFIEESHVIWERDWFFFMSNTILRVLISQNCKGTIFFLIEVINSK